MKQKVVFCGVINLYTGYGQHSAKIIEGLEQSGYDMYVRPLEVRQTVHDQSLKIPASVTQHFVNRTQQEPWEILLSPPKHVPTKGKKTLYFTMWESTRLSARSVSLLNYSEVVVVPNLWNAECFKESGVTRPIRMVPLGIDTTQFCCRPWPRSEKFIFGCAGRIAHGDKRKGLKDVIRAFSVAFPRSNKDVALWVKGFKDCPIPGSDDPRINLFEKYFTTAEYVQWLGKIHCFVSGARAEGWGWHQQEAMAVGRPLIASRYGGLCEFFNECAGICVPYKEVPAEEVWDGLGLWAQPSFDDMVDAMRWMFNNPRKAEAYGRIASRMACRFSNEHATKRLVDVMREFHIVK
jgi:glycosyltransferase involved in cell wall biosynthesis